MTRLLNSSWDEFVKDVDGKEIVLFGASGCAEMVVKSPKISNRIKYIIDNDINKHNKLVFDKYWVYSAQTLVNSIEEDVILITSSWYNEIIEQLEVLGYRGRVYSYLNMLGKAYSKEDVELLYSKLPSLKAICSDQKSVDFVDKIVEKRLNHIDDYSDICCGERQYFPSELFKIAEDEVFIDGGAFDGDTVREFIGFVDNKFKKVYSFEMDEKNFALIDRNSFDERVEFFNLGLWDKEEEVSFFGNDGGSLIVEDASEISQCIVIDNFIHDKVTFIKMDIEGAEMNALEGAKETIKRDKPKLAICIYHKFSDLWQIPLYIHQLVPEYKIYIRHYARDKYETVVYATI